MSDSARKPADPWEHYRRLINIGGENDPQTLSPAQENQARAEIEAAADYQLVAGRAARAQIQKYLDTIDVKRRPAPAEPENDRG